MKKREFFRCCWFGMNDRHTCTCYTRSTHKHNCIHRHLHRRQYTSHIESTVSERCHTPILREKEEEVVSVENTIGYKYTCIQLTTAYSYTQVEFECITVFFSFSVYIFISMNKRVNTFHSSTLRRFVVPLQGTVHVSMFILNFFFDAQFFFCI